MAGNPGKRPLNEREPQLTVRLPSCPKFLSGPARAEYRRVGRLLVRMGIVTDVDRAALAGYAQAYARWMQAEEAMSQPDHAMITATESGYQQTSPWLNIATQAQKQMLRYMVEFGMTPATRSRVQAAETGETESLAEILFGHVAADYDERD